MSQDDAPRPDPAPDPGPDAQPAGGAGAPAPEDLPGGLRAAVEAVLMVVDEPVDEAALAAAVGVDLERVRGVVEDLEREYEREERGFELRRTGTGWRVYSRADLADVVGRFLRDGQSARLSQAALETLAVVAYRQPVSRARVSAVRGVDVDGVVRTLLARGLVVEVAKDPVTGAMLYGTTPSFLERLGLRSLDELPPLAPFLPEGADLDDLTEGQL
ncbi:SMC-Scp complex subunit ScpB [Pseudokineococcus lusitanus]|uniref:Segregation and condensation protein B n=1 Tax=Pseudokineococcus lusitanus TaxID=763993 RepID=A0A3N1HT71_9ACTN|nr:SMC-Scp complex subunit ScpB [Pseudokineococcus lusitanus]ROP45620.1 segregation and condensation protein B [Pseudokineococcus lusitanus]